MTDEPLHPPTKPYAPPAAAPGAEVFATRMPCVRCGYDLRSMPVAGRCPECGGACEASLGSMWAADAGDRERVVRGLRLMVWAAVVFPLIGAGLLVIDIRRSTAGPEFSVLGLFGIGIVGPAIALAGVAMVSRAVRSASGVALLRPTATLGESAGGVFAGWAYLACSMLASIVIVVLTSDTMGRGPDEGWAWVVGTLLVGTGLGWTMRNLFVSMRCAEIAGVSNRPVMRRLFVAMAWISGVGGALVVCYGVGAIVAYVFRQELFDYRPGRSRSVVAALLIAVQVISSVVYLGALAWLVAWPVMLGLLARGLRRMGDEVRAGGGVVVGAAPPSE